MSQLGMTVVETASLIDYVAANPEAGAVMEGTGGVRKLRWARQGRGKSGGVRVVYYHHNATMPLFLLSVFAKNEKANLTDAEKREAKKFVKVLVEAYAGRGVSHG